LIGAAATAIGLTNDLSRNDWSGVAGQPARPAG
jgi:hypothetical protein